MKRVGLFGLIRAHSWLIRAAPLTRYLQPPSPGNREPREARPAAWPWQLSLLASSRQVAARGGRDLQFHSHSLQFGTPCPARTANVRRFRERRVMALLPQRGLASDHSLPERAELLRERVRILHRHEVPAARHHGEPRPEDRPRDLL